jgi:hypothetical protein
MARRGKSTLRRHNMTRHAAVQRGVWLGLIGLLAWTGTTAEARGLFRKRERTVAVAPAYSPTAATVPSPAPLGTFYPTPMMQVSGNFPTGNGYAPLGTFGDTSLNLYGPLSGLRATSAPVLSYVRGYDGRTAVVDGTSFSTPNLPSATPVVYPTQATYYYGFRETRNPPWWPRATNWIDQN